MKHGLTLPQALFLLARDDHKGNPLGNYNGYIQPAGAIAELILMDRLALAPGRRMRIEAKDTRPTQSRYLDAVLSRIATSDKPRSLQFWIGKLQRMKGRVRMIGQELAEQGLVEEVKHKYWGLFPVTRWRIVRHDVKNRLKSDISKLLFDQSRHADEWTSTLIAVANSGHLLKRNFPKGQLRVHRAHIKKIVKGDWPAANAATKAIQAVITAAASAAIIAST